MLLTQEPQVRFRFSEEFFLDVTEVYQRRWLEQSGQGLENVDRTHLVLGSGKPELQNKFKGPKSLLKLFPISKQKIAISYSPESPFFQAADKDLARFR